MSNLSDLLLSDDELSVLSDEEVLAYIEALQVIERPASGWNLHARQQTAEDTCNQLMAEGRVFELLYGGAGAGGKSEWLLWHQYHLALRFPGSTHLLLRRSFPELNRTAILRSMMRFDKNVATYRTNDKKWVFDNGSIIEFGYLDTDRDVFQYDSAEYGSVAFDELTQHPTDYPYRYLFSRLRVALEQSIQGFTPHLVSGTNPHRVGAAWVKARFVDPAEPGEVWEAPAESFDENLPADQRPQPALRVFITAKLTDNPSVNQAAYRQALAQLDTATRKAIEDGSWDVIEGQYFDEWSRDVHVVEPFEIPQWWERISGYDFGLANPACHLWAAVSPDGELIVYREMYGEEIRLEDQATRILNPERAAAERIRYRVGDPSIWTRTGAGPPIAAQFAELGVIFRKANNARVDGWTRVRSYLRLDPRTNQPRLKVFRTCTNLIRTLPMLVHDDKNPEDVDTHGEDHAADALRYLCMSRPLRSREPREDRAAEDRFARRVVVHRPSAAERNTVVHPVLGRIPR